jgi:LAO/AO transport system kinase
MVTAIESNLALQSFAQGEWRPPIIKTEATTGKGVPELLEAAGRFRTHSAGTRTRRLEARHEFHLRDLLTHRFMERVEIDIFGREAFADLVHRIAAREIDPYSAAAQILDRAMAPKGSA